MSYKNLIRSDVSPYHVTARSNNKEFFDCPMDKLWTIFTNYLFFIKYAFYGRIHSFVLMSNHFHMLISTPMLNLDGIMKYFCRETGRSINLLRGSNDHVFGSRYKWSIIQSPEYYHHAYRYVYQNPIRAGLCHRVEQYPYSSMYGMLGNEQLCIPVCEVSRRFSYNLPKDLFDQVTWLNQIYDSQESERIRKGFFRREFCILDKNINTRYLIK